MSIKFFGNKKKSEKSERQSDNVFRLFALIEVISLSGGWYDFNILWTFFVTSVNAIDARVFDTRPEKYEENDKIF